MPPETAFNPSSLTGLDRERLKSYKDNLDFYNGSQWQKSSRERQLVFNYAKVVCDKLTSYLLSNITFACDPITDQAAETARAAEQAHMLSCIKMVEKGQSPFRYTPVI